MNYKFYTLLYIDLDNLSLSCNGVSGDFYEQMTTFIKSCEALGKSLAYFTGRELTVLTNNKRYIENISSQLNCVEIDFNFKIPKDIKFFAAHHKMDVFKYFSKLGSDNYSILIDSDVLCINSMPQNLINCVNGNIPIYYDITEQVYPAYGRQVVIEDKQLLMMDKSLGLWAGGEFVGGDSNFFRDLYKGVELIGDDYRNIYKRLHHQGDEILVSVSLEKMMRNKYVCNAGSFGAIGRYWSIKTCHIQKDLKSFENYFLLHLPADKNFLALIKKVDSDIFKNYKNYLSGRNYFCTVFMKKIIKKFTKWQ